MKNKNLVVGVINWDCSLPEDTFFGYYSSKALSPKKYRSITPYYADILGDDKIRYHKRTMEEYEREMQYAIDAGIDYFAYCWYGESPKKQEIEWQNNLWELSYARRMHSKSSLNKQLKMCAILGVGAKEKELTESELLDLIMEMKEDYYQKIDGRPLLYIYDGHKYKLVEKVKETCRENGVAEPYFAYMYYEVTKDEMEEMGAVNTVSAYSFPKSAGTYDEFMTHLINDMDEKVRLGLKIIPRFSFGWNPAPRMDNPIPWYAYADEDYLSGTTNEDIRKGAERFGDWIQKNSDAASLGHILMFAWNEFEEGAHICPTYDSDGKNIDTTRLETVKKIISDWKSRL